MKIDLSRLHEKRYRMDHLYYIVDRNGHNILFQMNDVQRDVFENLHNRNVILKARQLGMSTFAVLYLLDEALFNHNLSAGIVSYSLQHAQHIFKRIIGHALDNMPGALGNLGIVARSAHEISFSNGSHLRVDTTLRGGTCQLVLVSEFGKTCARSPQKADEIVAGTLNTIPTNGTVIIESTGEGNEGYFASMVNSAKSRGNDDLSPLDYKLFFYPWYEESAYTLDHEIEYSVELTDYFNELKNEHGIELTQGQKNWYAQQKLVLANKLEQEFPSTVDEAFLSSSDAYYYAEKIAQAYKESRMLSVSSFDPLQPVYVAMDIGATDLTVLIFFQVVHGEIRIIDYYADNKKSVDFYANFMLQEKRYTYATIFLPHDANHVDGIIVENTYNREIRKLFSHTDVKFEVLKKSGVNVGITNVITKFDRMVFAQNKCKELVEHLSKYRKAWHESTGRYLDKPLHDIHSHYADSLRYVCQAVDLIERRGGRSDALQKHKAVVEARRRTVY